MRKAARRALWSMAACFVLTLILAALLFRPKSKSGGVQYSTETESVRTLRAYDWRETGASGADAAVPNITTSPADPPPAKRPYGVPVEESTGGVALWEESHDAVRDAKEKNHGVLANSSRSLGQHADGSSWANVNVTGGVYAAKASAEGNIELNRLASREGIILTDASDTGGVSDDSLTGVLPSREAFEAENTDFVPLSNGQDHSVVAGPRFDKNADSQVWDMRQDEETAEGLNGSRVTRAKGRSRQQALLGAVLNEVPDSATRPLDLRSGGDDDFVFAGAGEALAHGRSVPRRRVPFAIPAVVSNNVTEEVRYQIDTKDSVGNGTWLRRIFDAISVLTLNRNLTPRD